MSLSCVRWLGSSVKLCSRNVSTPSQSISSFSIFSVSNTNISSWSTRGFFKPSSIVTSSPVRRLSASSLLSVTKKTSSTISQASLSKPLQALRYKARPVSKKKPGGKVRKGFLARLLSINVWFCFQDEWSVVGYSAAESLDLLGLGSAIHEQDVYNQVKLFGKSLQCWKICCLYKVFRICTRSGSFANSDSQHCVLIFDLCVRFTYRRSWRMIACLSPTS